MDSTNEALKLFNDPSAWDGVYDVPIFVPHQVKVRDDKTISVNADRLRKIADKINQKFQRDGVAVVFTEGHRLPSPTAPEKDQPAILSYGKDARVGTCKGKPAILIRQYVRRGCLSKVKELPFRSAEFYDDTDEITGVALLRRDPKLDMGMVFYANSQTYSLPTRKGHLCLYMENTMPDPTQDLNNPNPMDPDMDNDLDPDFEKKADMYMGKKYPHFSQMYQDNCAKYMEGGGGPAFPSPTNGSVPGGDKDDDKDGMMGYQKEVVRYQKEVADKDAEIARLKRRMDYSKDLNAIAMLKAKDGQAFDVEGQLKFCETLTPEQFQYYKGQLAQSGAPVGGEFVQGTMPPSKDDDDMPPEKLDKVCNYMRTHPGVQYQEALEAVNQGKK